MSLASKNILTTLASDSETAGLAGGIAAIVYVAEQDGMDPLVRGLACLAIGIAVGAYAIARALPKKAAALTESATTWKTTALRHKAEKEKAEKEKVAAEKQIEAAEARALAAEKLAEERKAYIDTYLPDKT